MTAISWKTGSTDVWSDPTAWSTGTVPGMSDDVTIAVAPETAGVPYTVEIESAVSVHSIALDQAEAELQVADTTLSVGTTFALTAGTLGLDEGTLQGGTYSSTAGTVLLTGETNNYLNNVVWDGTLNLQAGGSSPYDTDVYLNTLTLHGAGGSGAGALDIGAGVAAVAAQYYSGPATLANVTITLAAGSVLEDTGTLTLASSTSVTATGNATLGYSPYGGYTLTNQGKITTSGTSTTLTITTGSFTNTGTILASGGGTILIDSVTGSNSGLLYAGAGSLLELETTGTTGFTNTGSLAVSGTLALDYALTSAQLKAFSVSSGTVAIAGTLTNTGSVLATGSTLGNLELDGGSIIGGTIVNSGHFGFATSSTSSYTGAGTLSSVTFDGAINLASLYDFVTVVGALTLTGSTGSGAGTLAITGNDAGVDFTTTEVLSDAVIKLGSNASTLSSYASFLEAGSYNESTSTTLVLGSITTLTQAGSYATLETATGNDAFLNQGIITAAVSGGTLSVSNLTNAGTISDTNETLFISNGGTASSGPTLTNSGTLSLSGSLAAISGAYGYYSESGATLANSGLVSVSNGATFTLGGSSIGFANTGTLAVSAATLVLDGGTSTSSLGTTKFSNGSTLSVYGTYTNAGTLSLGKSANIAVLALENGGLVSGGTIQDSGGGLVPTGGTLSGVKYDGTLDLTSANEGLTIAGGLTMAGASGTGAGSISVTGSATQLAFSGSQTLSNANVALGLTPATNTYSYADIVAGFYGETAATTLTLASNVAITQAGLDAELSISNGTDSIINDGTITAGYSDGSFDADGVINDGKILISAGDTLSALASNAGTITDTGSTLSIDGTFTNSGLLSLTGTAASISGYPDYYDGYTLINSGTFSVGTGTTLSLGTGGYAFSNTGTLLDAGGNVSLYGSYTSATFGTVKVTSGGIFTLDGTLTNSGTLTVGTGSNIPTIGLGQGGTIAGGTIVDEGGGLVASGGTLSGVQYDGTLKLTSANQNLTVTGGLKMAGASGTNAGSISVTGSSTQLIFSGSQTLSNTNISLGVTPAANSYSYAEILAGIYGEATASTLTLGSSVSVTQAGADAELAIYNSSDTLINDGTITAGYSNGSFNADGLINDGKILISANDSVSLLASNAGTIADTGGVLSFSGTFANFGLLSLSGTAAGISSFDYDTYTLNNSGTISVGAGTTLSLGGGDAFDNTGTLLDAGGDISLYGSYTTASLGTIKVTNGGTLNFDGTLTNSGTLTVGAGSNIPTLGLGFGGTIAGGTIVDDGGGIATNGGTLSGVTYQGALNLAAADASLTITGGLTLEPGTGNGLGTATLSGAGAHLDLLGSQTISNAQIDLAGAINGNGEPPTLFVGDQSSNGPSTITLAAGSSLLQTGSAYFEGSSIYNSTIFTDSPTGDTLINDGTISLNETNGYLDTQYLILQNAGALNVTNGEELQVDDGTLTNSGTLSLSGSFSSLYFDTYDGNSDGFTNTGLVTVGATDTLYLDGSSASEGGEGTTPGVLDWSNAGGTIDMAGGDLSAGGTFTTAQLGTVVVSNAGSVAFTPDAFLNNTGATLTVGTGSAIGTLSLYGTIDGGTIVDEGGGIAFNPYYNDVFGYETATFGTLDAVTYRGTLTLGAYDTATIIGGLTLAGLSGTGAGSVVLNNPGSILDFASTETLNNAYLYFGASGGGNTLSAASNSGTNTLTLGTALRLTQNGAAFTLGGNNGTIDNTAALGFAEAGGTLTLAGTFTNSGTIAVSNGETLVLATESLSNTGKISLTNGLLAVGNATSAQLAEITLSNSDLAVTGTLTAAGATLTVGSGTAIPTLKLQGTVFGGTIHDAGGGVQFEGISTLDNVTYQGTMTINRPLSTVFVEGTFAATSLTGSLPGSLSLTGAGSTLVWDTTQTLNSATISIGNAGLVYEGNSLLAPSLVAYEDSNIPLTLGASLVIQQSGTYADIGGADGYGSVLTDSGTVQSAATIDAGIAGGDLTLEGETFTTTGTIAISNGDTVTAGAATTTNAGLITIGAGSALNLNLYNYFYDASLSDESFINTGSITLAGGSLVELTDGGTFPNVAMLNAAGAHIKGFGTVAAPVLNDGVIEASGGTLAVTGAVTGTGTVQVDAGAVLDLTSVSSGQTATFSGTGGVLGLAPPSFLGVISGFAVGDTLDLASTAAKAASFSGDSIVVTLTAGGTITLATTSALTGTLTVTAGTSSDTLIKYSSAANKGPKPPLLPPVSNPAETAPTLADFTGPSGATPAEPNAATVAGLKTQTHDSASHWVPALHG